MRGRDPWTLLCVLLRLLHLRGTGGQDAGLSMEERQARSVALERAYVHDVYEQISATQLPAHAHRGRAWPKIKQFLSDLEPGSLVCDVGCGSGKYLSVNPSVFKVGVDRCCALTEIAREKEHEVLLCDNLALPFRDEAFDAVLSVAVVHHFATTERRVGALRELARVLRIGGRLLISVWAMEQRHRKFESQDVLVPWHRPHSVSAASLEVTSTTTTATTSEEDAPPPYHAYTQTSDSDSCRSHRAGSGQRKRGRSRHKGRSIDPGTSSPSSSSLSSPNETCYSFVRRALQKLAGSKRGGSGHRAWFLDSWSSCTKEPPPRCDPHPDDIADLPIELRRLEDDQELPQRRRQTLACMPRPDAPDGTLNHKSKSLSDILTAGPRTIVRSRSSVPSLGGPDETEAATSPTPSTSSLAAPPPKPRLVKQKQSLCGEDMQEEDNDEACDLRDLVKALPDFKVSSHSGVRRYANVFKQSSMNEELMSAERLREKEQVRQNIQKQASLNEELIYRRNRTLDSLRDTFFSTSTAKRFQILKNGLTSKLKSSTTGIEKVAGTSFKNGFVRMLQGWKGGEVSSNPKPPPTPPGESLSPRTPPPDCKRAPSSCGSNNNNHSEDKKDNAPKPGERRHSREDGSDSSKDSSLQSDTSVDSEDSFASVIFVPKPEQQQQPSEETPQPSPPPSPKVSEAEAPLAEDPPPPPQPSAERLRQIQELLRTRVPPPAPKAAGTRSSFPLVRRSAGRAEPLSRLLPLELFNPETDDLDSDSSGVSSPDSVSSVISVLTEHPELQPEAIPEETTAGGGDDLRLQLDTEEEAPPRTSPSSLSLLEAAADVASSLEDAVDAVIQSSPRARRRRQEEESWDESCRQHLADFAEKLSEKLLEEIDQYRRQASLPRHGGDDPYLCKLSEELQDLTKLSEELQKRNSYIASLNEPVAKDFEPLTLDEPVWKAKRNSYATEPYISPRTENVRFETEVKEVRSISYEKLDEQPEIEIQLNDLAIESVVSEKVMLDPIQDVEKEDVECESFSRQTSADITEDLEEMGKDAPEETESVSELDKLPPPLPTACSIESSDACESDTSRREGKTASTVSLSEDTAPKPPQIRRRLSSQEPPDNLTKTESCASSLSGSTSQESLPSDNGGGSITFHRYYHVFREGELDQLIEKYVENLHIISSYYDHANWCVVAEKVQVWTI